MQVQKGSVWDDVQAPSYPTLEQDIDVDICIVGGGLTGISAAYMLSGKGLRVVLLEKDTLARGATGATTAFLTSIIDTDLSDMTRTFGAEPSKLIIRSHQEAIDSIEHICEKEKIDCDLMRCSDFVIASAEDQRAALDAEFDAAKQLGYEVSRIETLGTNDFGAIEIKNQGKFHPLKYLYALAKHASDGGVQIFEHSEATALEGEGPVAIKTAIGTVRARYVFLATYEPFTKPLSLYFKKAFYISYMYAGTIDDGTIREGIYEDLSNPYNYFRIDKAGAKDRFVFGGADHRSDIHVSPVKNFKALEESLKTIFGDVSYTIDHKWRGPILEPVDGLPFIGMFGTRYIFIAMGFSGNGMTYATTAAKMFADHALGNGSPYTALYEPGRLPRFTELYVKGRDYLGELIGGAVKNAFNYED